MRLTLETAHGVYSVDRESGGDINDFLQTMVRPLCLAAGWFPEAIDQALAGDKYLSSTEEIEIEMDTKIIDQLDQIAKLSGLDRNDMIKAILGLELYRRGACHEST